MVRGVCGIACGPIRVDSGFMTSEAIEQATVLLDASNAGEIFIDHTLYETLTDRDARQLGKVIQVQNKQSWKLTC